MPASPPQTLEEFMASPTWQAWQAELKAGWPGPDGSSMSTDRIMGVRIGKTSDLHKYHVLPANRHDWRYRLARRHSLPEAWRRVADAAYREGCVECCRAELTGWKKWRLPLALARAHARYAGLRVGARYAWTKRAKIRAQAWTIDGG